MNYLNLWDLIGASGWTDTFERIFWLNGFDAPYSMVVGIYMIPAVDVLQGGIGKFIKFNTKTPFSTQIVIFYPVLFVQKGVVVSFI